MKKVMQIARREFLATVMTKAFLFGVLIVPVMMGVVALLIPALMMSEKAPAIVGEIAILDSTGLVTARAGDRLSPRAFAERRRVMDEAMSTVVAAASGRSDSAAAAARGADTAAIFARLEKAVPQLTIVPLATTVGIEADKAMLLPDSGESGKRRLAVVVVHANAVEAARGSALGGYDLYVRAKLDARLIDDIRRGMERAIVDARLAHRALDAADIRALTNVPDATPRTVDVSGEKEQNELAGMLIPMAFMILLLMAVMTGGGQLLTTTIEEKSSRVVEVLLAAVSPMELMAGKIFGQFGVSMVILTIYGGMGITGLVAFSAMGLLDPMMIVYLLIFFLLAFVTMGSMMAGIGSAVSEARDAQALLMPVMLINMLPMFLWMPITRAPNSMLAIVLSFLPPVGPFVMVLRLGSSSPPPTWQVWLSIAVAAVAAWGAVWFAGKVFRIGVLMYGKPPNLRTLVRWARSG
jgi:ABC-2 type transport system permease protein